MPGEWNPESADMDKFNLTAKLDFLLDIIKVFSTFVIVKGKSHIIVLVLFLSLFALPAGAQESIGLFNSPKGFGAELRTRPSDGIFHSALAYVDIYGVVTSRCSYPGFRLNVSRQYIINSWERGDTRFTWYAGPGISTGYVHDHDKGRGIDLDSLLGENEGFVVALSADTGCRVDFPGRIAFNLSFTGDLGIHVRRYEKEKSYNAPGLSIFNNGLMQALYPQFTILVKL